MSRQINLFNPIFLEQKKYFSAEAMVQGLGILVVGCALVVVYANFKFSALKSNAEQSARQLADLQKQRDEINGLAAPKKDPKLGDQVADATAEVASLQSATDLLQHRNVGGKQTQGYAEYMRAFSRQIFSGIWLTGFRIVGSGGAIEISGRALKPEMVPAYISKLKQEPVFQGKSFADLEMNAVKPEPKNGEAKQEGQAKLVPAYVEFVLRSAELADSAKTQNRSASSGVDQAASVLAKAQNR